MVENDKTAYSSVDKEVSFNDVLIKISEWYKFILRKWGKILIISLIGASIGLAYAIYKKPVYKAILSFALEDTKLSGGMGAYSGFASQFGLDVNGGGGGAFSGDNLLELMKSRAMIEKTLLATVNINNKTTTLAEAYIDFNDLRQGWVNKPELANIHFLPTGDRSHYTLKQDSLLGSFYKNIALNNLTVDKVDKKISITLVKVASTNELFSKLFAQILVQNVSEFYIETKTKKFSQNVNILQHQTDSVRQCLNNAISGVAISIDVAPNANPNRQVLKVPAQHRQVDVQVNTAILAELVKNLEMAKISLRNETPLVQIIDTPILPLDIDRVGKSKGLMLGFVLGFFAAVVGLTAIKIYQTIMPKL